MSNSTINKLIIRRKRFSELLYKGKTASEAYNIIANETFQKEHTISAQVNLYGYYRKFATIVKQEEKKRRLI